MTNEKDFRYILARGRDIATKEEVVGLVHIDEFSPRESFTTLLTLKDEELVTVDPVTVELYTGLRCAVSGRRIFEGDLIQLHSPIGTTINSAAGDAVFDYYGEICMPLNMVKAGASKRLYLYAGVDTPEARSTEGFYQSADHWDAMDWCIVGRTSIENEKPYEDEEKLPDSILEHHYIDVNPQLDETAANTMLCKGKEVWYVPYGVDWGDRPLFGTFKRRQHIYRRLKEFFDGKEGVTFGKDLWGTKFDPLRMEWAVGYQKYIVEPDEYAQMLEDKALESQLKHYRKRKRDMGSR